MFKGLRSSKNNTKTVGVFNSDEDTDKIASGRPLEANYYWVSKAKDMISGEPIYLVFYKSGRMVIDPTKNKAKAIRIAKRRNQKIERRMRKDKPLPKPRLRPEAPNRAFSQEIDYDLAEAEFEREQKEAGIKRQFQDLENPKIHLTAQQQVDKYFAENPPKPAPPVSPEIRAIALSIWNKSKL